MQAADEAWQATSCLPGRTAVRRRWTPEQQDAMLAFAKCMREHGVDMPDPDFGSGGGPVMIGGATASSLRLGRRSRPPDEACRSIMPDAMPGLVGGGAGGPGVVAQGPDSGGTTDSGPGLHVEPAQ